MLTSNLYIPKKIKVGFQERSDTFTGKLAYIVCDDVKGNLRQAKSWNGWRDKNIEVKEFDNIPTRYVINKGVQRQGYFSSGRSVIRMYDNRDFEFEISVNNLIGILMNSDVSKRDIVEECVFSWNGKDLVLLPVNTEEYINSLKFTETLSNNISVKDLVKGFTYSTKGDKRQLVYIGHDTVYDTKGFKYDYQQIEQTYKGKKHIFYDITTKQFVTPSTTTLSNVIEDKVYSDYAHLVDKYEKSDMFNKIISIKENNVTKVLEDNYRYALYKVIDDKTFNVVLFLCRYYNYKINLVEHFTCKIVNSENSIIINKTKSTFDYDLPMFKEYSGLSFYGEDYYKLPEMLELAFNKGYKSKLDFILHDGTVKTIDYNHTF